MLETIANINGQINNIVWGPAMLVLLVGTGIFLTFRVKFLQVRKFGFAMKHTLGTMTDKDVQDKSHGGVSPFQAVSTALASTVGTGNITGVATAIAMGGPGAIFWMWVSAFFGMVTKYSEIVLSIHFRERNDKGEWAGGPMYYLEKGLNKKWLAVLFAFFALFASFGIGNMSQANSIAVALNTSFGANKLIVGIILAIVVGLVIIGGIKRISTITSYVVPFMAVFYIILGIALIILKIEYVPAAFKYIFASAFNPQAIFGGGIGYTMMLAMRYGFARGVFSNEAGLGSAPIAHAAANTRGAVNQGLWGIFEVFFDSIIICTITGLAVTIYGLGLSDFTTCGFGALKGSDLAIAAYVNGVGSWGGYAVSIATVLFAASTIFGWSYYGDKALEYLFSGNASAGKVASAIYKSIFCVAVVIGSVGSLTLVWDIADTLNALMAIPNLIGLFLLSPIVVKITKDFFEKGITDEE